MYSENAIAPASRRGRNTWPCLRKVRAGLAALALLAANTALAQVTGTANARRLMGRPICSNAPSDAQPLVWDDARKCWGPHTTLKIGNPAPMATIVEDASGAWRPDPSTPYRTGRIYVRDWQAAISRLKAAMLDGPEPTDAPAVGCYLGDSWVANAVMVYPLRQTLQSLYGDAGVGYISLTSRGTDAIGGYPPNTNMVTTGTWTETVKTATTRGIDLSDTTSTDTATPARKVVTALVTEFRLHYWTQAGGGTFTWAVDGGAATPVDSSSTTGYQVLSGGGLAGLTVGSHTLTLTVTGAGTAGVKLMGVEARVAALGGVRFHRLGDGGTSTNDWLVGDATTWQTGLAALECNVVPVLLGTNDQAEGTTPAQYASNLAALIARIHAAVPRADIVLVTPADNGRRDITPAYAMDQYVAAAADLARDQQVGFINTAKFFGDYETAYARGVWRNPKYGNVHPSYVGGQIMADMMFSYLMDGLHPSNYAPVFAPDNYHNGNYNTFAGVGAGKARVGATYSTAFGHKALYSVTNAVGSSAFGIGALGLLTTGNYNSAFGVNSLAANQTAAGNSAFGWGALTGVTAGSNAGFGFKALNLVTTGQANTCIGYACMSVSGTGLTTNSGVGSGALMRASGAGNSAIGQNAGYINDTQAVTSTSYSTFLGLGTGLTSSTQHTYLTVVGAGATGDCDNCIVLGRPTDVTILRPPTSCTGLPSGTLWNNAGVLAICP